VLSHLKPLVDNKRLLDSFNNYIDLLIDQKHKVLEQSNELNVVHRAQGSITTLRRLKLLRDEVIGAEKK